MTPAGHVCQHPACRHCGEEKYSSDGEDSGHCSDKYLACRENMPGLKGRRGRVWNPPNDQTVIVTRSSTQGLSAAAVAVPTYCLHLLSHFTIKLYGWNFWQRIWWIGR